MLNRRPRRIMNQMNVVPYIDVMLVLLVIFMVTAPMFTPGVINVPSVSSATNIEQSPVEVQYSAKGQYAWALDGKAHTVANLTELIAAISPYTAQGRPVAISADQDAKYSDVVNIADQLHAAGISRVALTVQQRQQ